jgi:hypothetical protein
MSEKIKQQYLTDKFNSLATSIYKKVIIKNVAHLTIDRGYRGASCGLASNG